MLGNISFDTVLFTNKEDISSLKIFDFTKAFLIEHKEEFIKKVNLNKMDPYKISTLEKLLLENRYDDHTDYERIDNSYLAMKPPEFMIGKNLSMDPDNYFKFDVWGIGIILHLLLINCHLYEVILKKEIEGIHKTNIQTYLSEAESKGVTGFEEINFESNPNTTAYDNVAPFFRKILEMCLKLNVSERATVDEVLKEVELISNNRGMLNYCAT
eukprot:CAMPEP_0197009610 /NCGR_PEP_ID=MMETSP1380-20130617/50841_1 /TAXON_ID=5936 /ORGANISM="Euplotes crassus, Strain CT5" /LENGTH=212 /DNA_ID=CAMNT_0042430983 /DNA_START=563 /DNA_END=1197 /DNA_ORIENTATION=+